MRGDGYGASEYLHELQEAGTWIHPSTGRWHELDGFLMRGGEIQRMVR